MSNNAANRQHAFTSAPVQFVSFGRRWSRSIWNLEVELRFFGKWLSNADNARGKSISLTAHLPLLDLLLWCVRSAIGQRVAHARRSIADHKMAERENMSQGEHDTSKRLTGSQLIGRVVCFIGAILFLGNVTGVFSKHSLRGNNTDAYWRRSLVSSVPTLCQNTCVKRG